MVVERRSEAAEGAAEEVDTKTEEEGAEAGITSTTIGTHQLKGGGYGGDRYGQHRRQ